MPSGVGDLSDDDATNEREENRGEKQIEHVPRYFKMR